MKEISPFIKSNTLNLYHKYISVLDIYRSGTCLSIPECINPKERSIRTRLFLSSKVTVFRVLIFNHQKNLNMKNNKLSVIRNYLPLFLFFLFFNQLSGQNIQTKFCQVTPTCIFPNTVAIELKMRDVNNTGANVDQVEFTVKFDNGCLSNPIRCNSYMNDGTLTIGATSDEFTFSYNNPSLAFPTLTETWQTVATIEFNGTCNFDTPHLEWITADVINSGTPYTTVESFDMKPWDLDLQVFLQGAMDNPLNPIDLTSMRTDLSNVISGGGLNLIPLTQPYNIAPWYVADVGVPTIPSNVVDWLVIHLREFELIPDGINDHTFVVFLREDGQVIGLNGDAIITTPFSVSGQYRIIVEHRNHLPIISSDVVGASTSSTLLKPIVASHDFTIDPAMMWADSHECQVEFTNGNQTIYAMRGGNSLQFHPSFSLASRTDVNANEVLAITPSINFFSLYSAADIDMNGDVNMDDLFILIPNFLYFVNIPFN